MTEVPIRQDCDKLEWEVNANEHSGEVEEANDPEFVDSDYEQSEEEAVVDDGVEKNLDRMLR